MNRRWFATVVGRLIDGSVVAIPADPALHPVRDNPNLRQVLLVGEYPRSAQLLAVRAGLRRVGGSTVAGHGQKSQTPCFMIPKLKGISHYTILPSSSASGGGWREGPKSANVVDLGDGIGKAKGGFTRSVARLADRHVEGGSAGARLRTF